jgi:hypothetical protein
MILFCSAIGVLLSHDLSKFKVEPDFYVMPPVRLSKEEILFCSAIWVLLSHDLSKFKVEPDFYAMPPVRLSKEESETHAKRSELVFMSNDKVDASSQELLQDSVLQAFQQK